MARKTGEPYPLVISDLRGGRNGYDPPLLIPEDQCLEALNVDGWVGSVAHKRGGAGSRSLTFSLGGPFAGRLVSLLRHVPSDNETLAETWAVDTTSMVGRVAGTTTWTQPVFTDAITTPAEVYGASLGGFFHLAYDSAVDRLHLWDPGSNSVRRSGVGTPAAPTTGAMGAGGLSFTRSYRQRYVRVGTDTEISEASTPAAPITIAAKLGVTITKSAGIGEGETHWDVEAADLPAGPWYRIARTVVGTTTFDDTNATIPTTNLSAVAGVNTPLPSMKYIGTDDNRIYGAGAWETTSNPRRFWFTPVQGSSDIGDSERIPTGNFIGLEETPTAVSHKAFQGAIWVFAQSRIWKFVPTGVVTAPYQKFTIRGDIGCIHQRTLVQADDEDGGGALYFLTRKGPYRIGSNGMQYCGADIEDIWDLVNLSSTTAPHGVYYAKKHQVWWWVAVNGGDTPTVKIVFDTKSGKTVNTDQVRQMVRGGWTQHTGESAKAYCSCMLSDTLTITSSMSNVLKPYIGYVTSIALWECDVTATDDAGTAFQAYVDTKEYGTIGRNHDINEGVLIGEVSSGVTITVKPFSDFGLDSAGVGTASLTAAGAESRVQKRLEGLQTADIGTFRLRIGDSAAVSNGWILDAVLVNVTEKERRS